MITQELAAKTTTEDITLTGIDVFSSTNIVQLSAMRANSVDTCEIDLNLLHSALLADGSPNVRRLVQFLPIVAVANIQGNNITSLEVYHHNLMVEENENVFGDVAGISGVNPNAEDTADPNSGNGSA